MPPTAETKSLAEIQSEVCDTTLRVMAVLVIPALIISLSRAFDVGWQVQHTAQVAAALVAWGVTLFRHRFSFVVRANTVLALLFWLAWTGQVFTGTPTSLVFYVSASAMATVFYGARGGAAAMALSIILTASTYYGLATGLYPTPRPIPVLAVTTWLARGTSIVIAAAGPVIALVQFRSSLLRELHQAEAISASKSDFLAMMSHELRTPMTAILGIAEMLEQEPLGAGQGEKVGRITAAGKSLLTLLNDVLDFAKIDAGQMSIETAPFSLDDVLADTRSLFAAQAAEKGLALREERGAGPDAFLGDAARICQIVRNLVGNAIKFTDRGHVTIAVTQAPAAAGRVSVQIAVSDSGPGIAEADQPRLFQSFVQGESLRSRRHGGTGLGLAISRSLARLLGGDLTLVSRPGHGSTFMLMLPLAPVSQEALVRAPAEPVSAAHESLRVLAAEDNEAIRYLMKGMFEKRGHAIDCVEDGAQAVAAVQARPYDVVVMDMHMPVMDGAAATRAIRALPTASARLPVIALTAGLTENERAAYIAAGVDQVVAKPAHWPTLFAAVEARAQAFNQVRELLAEEPPEPPADLVIEEEILGGLEEAIGADAVAQMLTTMRASLDDYHTRIRAAAEAGELTAARKAGHGLKGTSRQFGAAELGMLGARIETGALTDAGELLPQIAPALARFDAAVAARRKPV